MRRLKKKFFYGLCGSAVAVLGVVRMMNPAVVNRAGGGLTDGGDVVSADSLVQPGDAMAAVQESSDTLPQVASAGRQGVARGRRPHPVMSVYSYAKCFPDVQDVQITAARRWGVKPVRDRAEAEERKSELVYVGASPFYCIDANMNRSIPYLVPRASNLLHTIGRNFLDSLYVKGVPLHRIIVSSLTRTEEDVARLMRYNGNASEQSCHRYGTTMDIPYNRYSTVSPPGGPQRREVSSDTLKWVLSEVLRDIRESGMCYVKYEVKQGCFHITVR